MKLVNTAAVQQFKGLKFANDHYDAFWLAHLLRLGILPTGYIYPKEQRLIRDLLRRRMQLVHVAASRLISIQSQIWRSTGIHVSSSQIRKTDFQLPLSEAYERQATQSMLTIYHAL